LIYNWTSDFLFFVLKMYVKLVLPLFDQSRYWQQRSPDPSQKHHHHMSLGITSFCKKKNTKHFSVFIMLWNIICTTHLKIYQMISWPNVLRNTYPYNTVAGLDQSKTHLR
jgi:hypothetical protein